MHNNNKETITYKTNDLKSFIDKNKKSRMLWRQNRENKIITYGNICKYKIFFSKIKCILINNKNKNDKYDWLEILE